MSADAMLCHSSTAAEMQNVSFTEVLDALHMTMSIRSHVHVTEFIIIIGHVIEKC